MGLDKISSNPARTRTAHALFGSAQPRIEGNWVSVSVVRIDLCPLVPPREIIPSWYSTGFPKSSNLPLLLLTPYFIDLGRYRIMTFDTLYFGVSEYRTLPSYSMYIPPTLP